MPIFNQKGESKMNSDEKKVIEAIRNNPHQLVVSGKGSISSVAEKRYSFWLDTVFARIVSPIREQ